MVTCNVSEEPDDLRSSKNFDHFDVCCFDWSNVVLSRDEAEVPVIEGGVEGLVATVLLLDVGMLDDEQEY